MVTRRTQMIVGMGARANTGMTARKRKKGVDTW
jgi:hypothetical protein